MAEEKALLLFSIGPVQSYIAQARKAQDLFWGSYLLSYLTAEAIKLAKEKKAEIIFPDIENHPFLSKNVPSREASLPNRFLAIVRGNSQEELEGLGNEIKEKVRSKFKEISERVGKDLIEGNEHKEAFDKQINDFLQIYWVAVPWQKDLDSFKNFFTEEKIEQYKNIPVDQNGKVPYGLIHGLAEKGLAARKQFRTFEQLEETGRKCSICGERNVLFYRKSSKEQQEGEEKIKKDKLFHEAVKVFPYPSDDSLPLKYLQPGEGLCGVCFVKRGADKFFKPGYSFPSFPSVAEVALQPFLKKMRETNEGRKLVEDYIELVDKEYQLFYEENLTEEYFRKQGLDFLLSKIDEIKEKNKIIREHGKNKNISIPKYYAILALDGDDMGSWLAGERGLSLNGAKENASLLQLHKDISKALRCYSTQLVPKIVRKYLGTLVYAGGDDVLAFSPLEDLLDIVLKLRGAFSGEFNFGNEVGIGSFSSMGPKASCSAGVCIAHYKTPLRMVVKTARSMLEKAKDWDTRKNAFGIAVIKHSGERLEGILPFFRNDSGEDCIEKLKMILAELKRGQSEKGKGFSPKFVAVLKEEFSRLGTSDDISDDILESELKRLLKRSCQVRGKEKEKEKDELIKKTEKNLLHLYLEAKTFDNFISILETCLFLLRKT